ncbi:MAG: ribonuclease Y [Myxococcota bacterium]|nr:ribonuclease Y [Myxococcota bacterium]
MEADWLALVVAVAVGGGLGAFLYRVSLAVKGRAFDEQAADIVRSAELSREKMLHTAQLEAKEAQLRQQEEFDSQMRSQRVRFAELDQGLRSREMELDEIRRGLEEREQALRTREGEVTAAHKQAEGKLEEAEKSLGGAQRELERIGELTLDEARSELIEKIREEAEKKAVGEVRRTQERIRREAEAEAQVILASAVQRMAGAFVTESTVSVVELPSDDLKGRIIEREGRNIRAIEQATGVDVIIDDTPEVVVLSCFDPVRREVGRQAMLRLVEDGRIHPARIEEVVEEVRGEVEVSLKGLGDEVALELGVHGVHPELLKLLGGLKFRSSQGQNLLEHGRETSYICGLLAAEIGTDIGIARRIGLLYGVGRSVSHEVEGGHAKVAADQCRRHGEKKRVVEAIRTYQSDRVRSVEAVLLNAAVTLSRSRPGSKQETFESYIRRHEQLEDIGKSFEGVDQAYVVQAGTEIRVIVDYSKISDDDALVLSGDIAERIERELTYPGEVRVTVIREARVTEIAR